METYSYSEIFRILFGFGYLVDHRLKVIHQINEKHHNCNLKLISDKSSEYVTRKRALKLINTANYKKCQWCW